MRAMSAFALMILAAPLVAAPVPKAKSADDPVPASAARLLQHRKIQKELKLTSDQRIALVDGLADIDEAIEKKREKLLRIPNPMPDIFEKIEEEHRKQTNKFLESAAAKTLTANGRNRLRQINSQIRGIEAFTDPAAQKLLALTDAQKKSVEKIVKEQEEKIDSYLNQVGNDNADNLKEELLKFRSEQSKAIVAGFSAEQKVLWTSFLGEPVKSFDPVEMWITLLELDEDPPIP